MLVVSLDRRMPPVDLAGPLCCRDPRQHHGASTAQVTNVQFSDQDGRVKQWWLRPTLTMGNHELTNVKRFYSEVLMSMSDNVFHEGIQAIWVYILLCDVGNCNSDLLRYNLWNNIAISKRSEEVRDFLHDLAARLGVAGHERLGHLGWSSHGPMVGVRIAHIKRNEGDW